jgi:transcriptional regulator with XRE-family HTH domain
MTDHNGGQARRRRKSSSEGVAVRFGENLRRFRRREGLSQEELAVRASLHRTEIGMLEKGERIPRIDTLVRLAGSMAIPPEELLVGIYWTAGGPIEGSFTFTPQWLKPKRRAISESVIEDPCPPA